jgi:hypothetical protein
LKQSQEEFVINAEERKPVPDLISSNEAGGCNYLTLKIEGINVFGEKSIKNAKWKIVVSSVQ